MFFAIIAVLPRPVDLVNQRPCGIMPGALVVRFNRLLEHRAFIIRVKLDLFQPGMAFLVDADIILCAEFCRVLCFSPDYNGLIN